MKQTTLIFALVLTFALGCSDRKGSDAQTNPGESSTKLSPSKKKLISIVEIPTDSFQRATRFYESILDLEIQAIDMQGTKMGLFPGEDENVALVNGTDYKPSSQGTLVYLNGGEDLQVILDKIEKNGGKVIVPKTLIDSENGFFATFLDSEGNKLGLHSFK